MHVDPALCTLRPVLDCIGRLGAPQKSVDVLTAKAVLTVVELVYVSGAARPCMPDIHRLHLLNAGVEALVRRLRYNCPRHDAFLLSLDLLHYHALRDVVLCVRCRSPIASYQASEVRVWFTVFSVFL